MAIAEELKLVIRAEVDQAIKGLKDFQRESDKSKNSSTRLMDGIKRLAIQYLSARYAVQAAARAISDSIKAFEAQELAEAKLSAVLKSTSYAAGVTAEQLKSLASEMQQTTRFGDEMVINAESILLTFRHISGDVFPRTIRAAADLAETMGIDLQSAVLQLGKALDDPTIGLTALRRSGVSFTESQQEMIKGLVEQNKTMEAQKLILAEVEKQMGGVAKAMGDTASGSMAKMRNAFVRAAVSPCFS